MQRFSGTCFFSVPVSSSFSSVKTYHFYVSFLCGMELIVPRIFHCCSFIWQCWCALFLQNFWWPFFHYMYFEKVFQKNILCSAENIYHTHTDHLLCMGRNTWQGFFLILHCWSGRAKSLLPCLDKWACIFPWPGSMISWVLCKIMPCEIFLYSNKNW